MKFKCNFCEQIIPVRTYGAPAIKCQCGAKYTKKKYIEVTLAQPPST